MTSPLEHDHTGLTNLKRSSEDEKRASLNLQETELRLGLPGSNSPERNGFSLFGDGLEDKNNGYSLSLLKTLVTGSKRGFSNSIDGPSGKWVFYGGGNSVKHGFDSKGNCKNKQPSLCEGVMKEAVAVSQSSEPVRSFTNENGSAPATKAQVIGWPPVRSYRKNTMASNLAKISQDPEGNSGAGCSYVKVSMDGAPYLRKIDLETYSNYMELSAVLENMFSCFTIGKCGFQGLPGRDGLNVSRLIDLLHGSEYVLTYEDEDGDWMLVGDVPWAMFKDSCKRLMIMKGSDAIGLAPRAMGKCKSSRKIRAEG